MNFDNFEAIWGQLWDNLGTTLRQLWGTFGATFGQLGDNFETTLSPVWTWRQRGSRWRSWSPSWERSTSWRLRSASADKTISLSIFSTRSSSQEYSFQCWNQDRHWILIKPGHRDWYIGAGRGGREGINNLYFDFDQSNREFKQAREILHSLLETKVVWQSNMKVSLSQILVKRT